jgi:hypothetical protein
VPDDIAASLRQRAHTSSSREQREVFTAAADEIERLREAGDVLAEALRDARRRHPCDCLDGYDDRSGAAAIGAWEESPAVPSDVVDADADWHQRVTANATPERRLIESTVLRWEFVGKLATGVGWVGMAAVLACAVLAMLGVARLGKFELLAAVVYLPPVGALFLIVLALGLAASAQSRLVGRMLPPDDRPRPSFSSGFMDG